MPEVGERKYFKEFNKTSMKLFQTNWSVIHLLNTSYMSLSSLQDTHIAHINEKSYLLRGT